MNFIFMEISFIDFTRFIKVVFSFAMELSINKIAFVKISVEFKFTLACFKSISKVSFVNDFVVVPLFSSFAVVCIIKPFTFIHGPFCIYEDSLTASHAVFPFTLIHITVAVSHSSHTIELTVFRHSLIL